MGREGKREKFENEVKKYIFEYNNFYKVEICSFVMDIKLKQILVRESYSLSNYCGEFPLPRDTTYFSIHYSFENGKKEISSVTGIIGKDGDLFKETKESKLKDILDFVELNLKK